MKPVYLDYNATTPHHPEVLAAMRPYLEEHFGNPSSGHWYGEEPRRAVERARRQVAGLLGCRPEEIVFTSGGTESNNYALRGAALACRDRGNHILTTQIEHPAVLEVCRSLERVGFEVSYLPVDEHGRVRLADMEAALRADTILISVMHANNEIGTIQPIAGIAALARRLGILLHTDAAQSAGKIPVRVDDLGVDLLSLAGHKLYAPKGVGALFVRRGLGLVKLMEGAGQEGNCRPGTENVVEIAGLGQACEIAARDLETNAAHLAAMRDRLEAGLRIRIPDLRVHGHPRERLPNTLSAAFAGVDAPALLTALRDSVAASAGAACHSAGEVSGVLRAMQVPPAWARGTVRFSTGRLTTPEEVDRAVEAVAEAVAQVRAAVT
ncbi:MAG TPA: aminotransferase class V-fold PLP-dependent enzyme [Bryobacteraceae bacterium]|nr:aminotransferase class V-fold PLP-dependent enzyme [Bryobacteraceae bacterium]